jgi:adenosylhomocysteine nucleosidase
MRSELRPVVRAMGGGGRARLGGMPASIGRAGRAVLTVAMIGVGPPAARRSTERLLDAAEFDHVVVSGIAGGIGPGIAVGDLVTPSEVEDLTTGRRFTPATMGDHRPSGVLSTTAAELILDDKRLAELTERGVVALDMETAAVAEVCQARGRPWSVFRVVSDRPEDGLLDHGVFELLETDGTVNVLRTLRYVMSRPSRIGPLARLARDSGRAARTAARASVEGCRTL